jgi:predicted regulator of Ras-like GTPase activity (Roadblock/LC7/MglB family)
MTAALMSAAETAFFHLGGGRGVRIIAETESTRMITLGADDELLLVVIARASSDNERILPRIEETAGRMRSVLAEAGA